MRPFSLYAIILLIPIFVEAQTSPVSVQKTKTGERILLARPLQKAVHDFDSGFVPLTSSDYIKALRDHGHPSGAGRLSFCTGDFDGNGFVDVALLGRSGGGMRLLTAFQKKKNVFKILRVKEFPFFEPGEEDAYLTANPARALNVTSDNRTISFETDSFMLNYYRRGSVLYHWRGGEFVQYQLGQ